MLSEEQKEHFRTVVARSSSVLHPPPRPTFKEQLKENLKDPFKKHLGPDNGRLAGVDALREIRSYEGHES